MSTIRQKNLAQEILKNEKRPAYKRINKKQLLVSSGYSEITASQNAKPTIESKGIRKELKKLGFDEDSAKSVVKDILNREIDGEIIKASDKLKASEQVFKVLGSYAPEKHIVAVGKVPLDNPEIEKVKAEAEEKLKELLLKP